MSDYRAYLIGSDGHIFKSAIVDEVNDASAIVVADDVELWQRDRKIAEFKCDQEQV
jgi:hypothetical protein